FFSQYGSQFGIQNPAEELILSDSRTDNLGMTRLTYEQTYQGVPVFGGTIFVHLNEKGAITAVNGSFIPDIQVNPTPTLSQEQAANMAVTAVLDQLGLRDVSTAMTAVNTHLTIYRTGLAQGIPGVNHLAYEVEVSNKTNIREFLFMDAHNGKIIDQISGINESLDRKIYNGGFGPGFLVWQEGNTYPFTGTDQDGINDLIDYAEDTYNLFLNISGGSFLSWDAADSTMHSVLNDPAINCPNANWNGVSTNSCNNVSGDDTVAHEWGHAYTESTHGLIYAWQPGALNESYSDIWGEVVDFLNGAGTDSPGGLRSDGACSVYGGGVNKIDDSYRWLSGEDDPAFGGAIRDLWNPTCYGDPGKVSDSQYWCTTSDGGGVHTNSGVPNHGFALLVDGGTYNGQTVSGIGLTKAAHIYWRAETTYQTQTTDFADHAAALAASCTDLANAGTNLYALSTDSTTPTLSGQVITGADCTELGKVITAVEFNTEPTQCGFTPLLDANAPALCEGLGSVNTISLTDWEAGLGSWTAGTRNVADPATFDTPDWAVVGSLPNGRAGQAAFVKDDPALGDCNADTEAGALYLQSPIIKLPSFAYVPRIAIDHWVATEAGWDGGNFKISVNGGPWTLIPSSAFDFNAYNDPLNNSDNPLGGESAFTGTNGGEVSGSWGQSQIDLTGIATAGDSIELRVEMGLDGCNGVIGWYVDEVQVYSCAADRPDFTLSATPASRDVCLPNETTYDVTVGSRFGYSDPVTLSAPDLPLGALATFDINPVTPSATSVMTVATGGAGAGPYNISVVGVAPTSTHTTTVTLNLYSAGPGSVTMNSPADAAADVSVKPTFSWTAVSGSTSYTLELSTSSGFSSIDYTATVTGTSHTLATSLRSNQTYYWRVRAANVCGAGSNPTPFSFTTREVLPFVADFNGGTAELAGSEWTVINNGGDCVWESSETTGNSNFTGGDGYALEANSDWCGAGTTMNTEIRTPSFSLIGANSLTLIFRYEFKDFGGGADSGSVDVSNDGGLT
ncbi:MAG: M4 family metallopeptidase, partial [Anaerolineae bacterium]